MTHHTRLWQLPLFSLTLILFYFFGASKWCELTHYFLPSRADRGEKKKKKHDSQGHVHTAKHHQMCPHVAAARLTWRSYCHYGSPLGLFLVIHVHQPWWEPFSTAASWENFLWMLIQPLFESECCKDKPDYGCNAIHYFKINKKSICAFSATHVG